MGQWVRELGEAQIATNPKKEFCYIICKVQLIVISLIFAAGHIRAIRVLLNRGFQKNELKFEVLLFLKVIVIISKEKEQEKEESNNMCVWLNKWEHVIPILGWSFSYSTNHGCFRRNLRIKNQNSWSNCKPTY